MVILTWFEGYWSSGLAVLLRKICTIIAGFALVAFVIMSILKPFIYTFSSRIYKYPNSCYAQQTTLCVLA